jgi:hypothetical protein
LSGITKSDESPETAPTEASPETSTDASTSSSTTEDGSASTAETTASSVTPEVKPQEEPASAADISSSVQPEATEKQAESEPTQETETAKPEATTGDPDHDFRGIAPLFCNGCGKDIGNWTITSLHMCLYCTDMDLCGDCFETRRKEQSGELPPAWRTMCPANHRHLTAPMAGWGGVKNGVITVDGEKTLFDDWIKDLKEVKWPRAWEAFWAREMA